MKARVLVRLKKEVSDPQGMAIGQALNTMHYDAVKGVRAGKVFDLELAETDAKRARTEVEKIARDVLSNPVIEDFTFEIIEGGKS
ncbi:phosphoribosylformylglycinamidine synthase subunit PurS [Candidatus Sumerlaeota bacterium]|nr:phosphoribosylformylglycinamidine synthase subunit PurS [Candidatus Sumerlaeota bacterium]